jgi:lipopolysaccharide export system permease protein
VKTLDRYVLREWLRVFAITGLGFPVVVVIIDLTDRLDTYLARGLSQGQVALAYVFYLPETVFLVLPAAVLFATVFTVGGLGRHSELVAAKASGISFHRLCRPIFLAAAAVVLLGVALAELAPVATTKRLEVLGEKAIRSRSSRPSFVFRAEQGWVYAIRSLDIGSRTMRDLILTRAGTGLDYPTLVIAAPRAIYSDSAARWTIFGGAQRALGQGEEEFAVTFDSLRLRVLRETPADLLAEPKTPEEMRYAELGRYIDALARSGTDHKKLRVKQALKLSVPFTCIIIAFFGAPLAITTPRQGTAFGVALALGTTVVFLIGIQLSQAVGTGGVIPPTLAAWVPNVLFGGAALVLLRRART